MTPEQQHETIVNSFLNVLDSLTGPVNGKALANPEDVAERLYREMTGVLEHYDETLAKVIREGWPSDTIRDVVEYGLADDDFEENRRKPNGTWYKNRFFRINYPEGDSRS